MTVQVIQMFEPTVLTTSAATLYTVTGTGVTSTVLGRGRIRFTNPTGSAVAVTAYAVPFGGTAGAGNVFCPALSVAGGSNLDIDVPALNYGDFIQAFASAGSAIVALALDGVMFS